MKNIFKFSLGLIASAIILPGLASCQDDIDTPKLVEEVPVATLKPNSTILEVKAAFWNGTEHDIPDGTPYCLQIGTKENGDHYIVKGRVISSDYAGNIFKSLYIQDETGVLPLSINSYNLYLGYRVGQEVVIDLTDLYIGRYAGLEQLGYPQWSASYNAYQPTFMQPGILDGHIELNGLPEPEKVDTILISSLADLNSRATDAEFLQKMQGQLVRINNVKFNPQDDLHLLGIYHENVSQQIEDETNSTLTVRTSGYSNFWNTPLPEERGDIVGILGYYYSSSDPSSSWQLTMIDKEGMMNFGNPTLPHGVKERPWTVSEAVAMENKNDRQSGWVEGYIVGTVAPEVENITSASQIEWGAQATLPTSVVIGQTADTKELSECLVISLPQGSVMRDVVALATHPENYGKKLAVLGVMEKYMGTYGVTGNTGKADEFILDGVEIPVGGTGTETDPYTVSTIVGFNPQSTTVSDHTGVWVKGYIVGTYHDYDAHFETANASNNNILLAETPGETDKSKCIDIQLPAGDVRNALNLVNNPYLLGKEVMVYGDVLKYNTMPGIKNTTKFVNNNTPDPTPGGSGSGTKTDPYDIASIIGFNPQSTTASDHTNVWVKGYIVGTYYDYNAHFETAGASNNNILMADSPNVTDKSQCIDVQLPAGDVRNALNLASNPSLLGKEVMVYGDVLKYNSMPGVKNTSDYVNNNTGGTEPPVTTLTGLNETFDGSTSLPSGWKNVTVEGNKSWYVATFSNNNYASMTGYKGTAPFDSWLVSPAIDLLKVSAKTLSFISQVNGYGSTTSQIEVYVMTSADPATATKTKLQATWPTPPASGYSSWENSGSLSLAAFSGTVYIGFRYTATTDANYATWCIDNVAIPAN